MTIFIVSPLTCTAMKTSKGKNDKQQENIKYQLHELKTVSTMPIITKNPIPVSKNDKKNSSSFLPQYKKIENKTPLSNVKSKYGSQRNKIIKLAFKELKDAIQKNFKKSK